MCRLKLCREMKCLGMNQVSGDDQVSGYDQVSEDEVVILMKCLEMIKSREMK